MLASGLGEAVLCGETVGAAEGDAEATGDSEAGGEGSPEFVGDGEDVTQAPWFSILGSHSGIGGGVP
ncbi:hypothetical protein COW36_19000 [bacterium (Candidatus Blackallbacteria) CG17_big_fil_post_rev_8_21_14_2_50_48_46]|uniref:Uncharacterized protein n=1 Tax=bacterium (Candidatus Blackallbacteria) CG17_big_fil_post_rev_8_21_14_2_50_48_46 TaxID=2014261 RepID=A0A2M7G0L5_9BACT|nr:MAG: hypothetical protein COW64_25470 [bacterium (Candidatus Blackallbacteria) CG18_big_fil_WC_8_21_14_2_50_49_26]PIW15015.1 MAG: hypothetical protein COW36_19000 [bacterium (Candidatus Blackallbacteria) CG17_big_fil_post_rev_8_21_14_2_50_48_46]PIW44832.1 MAG: hypothetical protein COW20_22630 [bacterium (Candidatus Blackallbacteria) CG13_big_fil_rev_8_21_14_2_50_49_14]